MDQSEAEPTPTESYKMLPHELYPFEPHHAQHPSYDDPPHPDDDRSFERTHFPPPQSQPHTPSYPPPLDVSLNDDEPHVPEEDIDSDLEEPDEPPTSQPTQSSTTFITYPDARPQRHGRTLILPPPGAKPRRMYTCWAEGCTKIYGTRAGLRYHVRKHHKGLPPRPQPPKIVTHTCGRCGKGYATGAGLRYHLKTFPHEGENGALGGRGPDDNANGTGGEGGTTGMESKPSPNTTSTSPANPIPSISAPTSAPLPRPPTTDRRAERGL
ncbi:hypothetical protein HDV00_012536, partial [Rhizophlyctis rosea]